jgi:hypothetical protein
MSLIKAVVRNGRIETDEPLDLPEGTELLIPIPDRFEDDEPGWDNSPEGIAAWLAWSESLEPLIFTEEEKAAWEADRRARKEWGKDLFDEYTDPSKAVRTRQ